MLGFVIATALAGSEPAAVSPASDAAVDAFIAALPSKDGKKASDRAPLKVDESELAAFQKRNPAHEAQARVVFVSYAQCQHDAGERAKVDALRSSARRLGEAKLSLLTTFYTGPDFPVYAKITSKKESELTPQDKAELKRLSETYPLLDYLRSVHHAEQAMWSQDGLFGEMSKCEARFDRERTANGLKP